MNLDLSSDQADQRDRIIAFSNREARCYWNRLETNPELLLDLTRKAQQEELYGLRVNARDARPELMTVLIAAESAALGEGSLGLAMSNKYLWDRAMELLAEISSAPATDLSAARFEGYLDTVVLWPEDAHLAVQFPHPQSPGVDPSKGELKGSYQRVVAHPSAKAILAGTAVTSSNKCGIFLLLNAHDKTVVIEPRETLGLRAGLISDVGLDTGPGATLFEVHHAAYRRFWLTLALERRLIYSAIILGIARGAFEYALDYSKERVTFGKPISQHQVIAMKLADMAINLEASRLLIWKAAETDEQPLNQEHVESAWTFAGRAAFDAVSEAVQILGGHGYLKLHPVEKWMRDVQFMRILLGDTDTDSLIPTED